MRNKTVAKRIAALLLAAGMTAGMAACGSDGNNSGDAERKSAESIKEDNQAADDVSEESAENEAEEAQSAKKTEYPLTITTYTYEGEELTTVYEKAPEKVLAVYQGSIETMLALGLEDHIAAAAGLDNEVPDEQKAAFSEVNYLDEFTPSLETATMLEPDMIFSWGSLFSEKTLGDSAGWVDKGVNTYINTNTHKSAEPYNKTLENEYQDILNIGKIFDVQDKAEAIVNEMRDTVSHVLEQTEDQTEKPTAMIIEFLGDSISNYGADSLGGDMVTQLGATLASPDASTLGKEDIVNADPDVIFVVYMPYTGDDPDEVRETNLQKLTGDEAFGSLSAVKNGRVVPIMLSEMYASATRTQDGIITFANGLYPDLNLEA